MIGLDTNVLVRYIMQDDQKQANKATKLIESLTSEHPGFISVVSIVELYWVLTSCYGLSNHQIKQALDMLLRSKQIIVDRAEQVLSALLVFADGKADFADCLIERTAASAGCEQTLTFDVNAAKHAGMSKQLGHSLEVFFRDYADWVNGQQDAAELTKIEAQINQFLPNSSPSTEKIA
jgi:predicted nucleic-acid-binding protein